MNTTKLEWQKLKQFNHAKLRAPRFTGTTKAQARAKRHNSRRLRVAWNNKVLNAQALHFDPTMRIIQ